MEGPQPSQLLLVIAGSLAVLAGMAGSVHLLEGWMLWGYGLVRVLLGCAVAGAQCLLLMVVLALGRRPPQEIFP